jgi:hypothetical protein
MGHPPLGINKQEMDGQQIAGEGARRGGGFLPRQHGPGDRLRRAASGQPITGNRGEGDRALKALREELVDECRAVLTKMGLQA